jgi:hypothetical protein
MRSPEMRGRAFDTIRPGQGLAGFPTNGGSSLFAQRPAWGEGGVAGRKESLAGRFSGQFGCLDTGLMYVGMKFGVVPGFVAAEVRSRLPRPVVYSPPVRTSGSKVRRTDLPFDQERSR